MTFAPMMIGLQFVNAEITKMKTYIGIDVSKLHLDIHQGFKSIRIPKIEKSITAFLNHYPSTPSSS